MEFAGLIFGTLISDYVFRKFDIKKTLVISIGICITTIIFWIFIKLYVILCILIFLTGLFQTFYAVYTPVWIDV